MAASYSIKALTSIPLIFLSLNLLFFSLVTSTYVPCPPPPPPPKTSSHPIIPKHPPKHSPPKSPTPPSTKHATCPRDTLKLAACANLLNDLVHLIVGTPPLINTPPCCSLIEGLVDLEAAVCLCTAIKAHVLGINLNVPLALSLILNTCGKNVPSGFQCA